MRVMIKTITGDTFGINLPDGISFAQWWDNLHRFDRAVVMTTVGIPYHAISFAAEVQEATVPVGIDLSRFPPSGQA